VEFKIFIQGIKRIFT